MALGAFLTVVAPAPAIVGGTDAVANPGIVSIYTTVPDRNRCSGTLVDDGLEQSGIDEGSEWVLTAAHCWYPLNAPGAGTVEVRIGGVTNADGSGYTSRTITQYWYHPTFNPENNVGDVMLVKLNAMVPRAVQEPARYTLGSIPVGTNVHIAGYGWVCDGPPGLPCSTNYEGPLQRMTGQILPDGNCWSEFLVDQPRQACFGRTTVPAMAAPGDSGTGAFTKDAQARFVVRMVVLGEGDSNTGSVLNGPNGTPGLGMGMEVGPYVPWMQGVMDTMAYPPTASPPAMTDREYQLRYELAS
jgi:secreted trypsin-like serine protease